MKRIAWILLLALAGCATAYQEKGLTGGFSDTLLAPDMFKIDFTGNGFTSSERASDFAMLRAADISLNLGCSYFAVLTGQDKSINMGSIGMSSVAWNQNNAWATSSVFPVMKPDSSLLAKCFKVQPPAPTYTFNARFIEQSIRSKYGISQNTTYVAAPEPTAAAPSAAPTADPVPAPDYASTVSACPRHLAHRSDPV